MIYIPLDDLKYWLKHRSNLEFIQIQKKIYKIYHNIMKFDME